MNKLDSIFGALEDILQDSGINPAFSVNRMKHFIELSSDYISWKIGMNLSTYNFSENTSNFRSKLLEYIKNIKLYSDRIDQFNTVYFANKPFDFKSTQLNKIYDRINEIYELKILVSEVVKIFPDSNLTNNLAQVFSSLKSGNAISQLGSKTVEEIKITIDKELVKIEEDVMKKIKEEIFVADSHVLSVLRDMQNWKGIFSRQKILKETKRDREGLLNKLIEYLQNVKQTFETRTNDTIEENSMNEKIINVSSPISTIIWGHTLLQKIENSKKISNVLSDLNDYPRLIEFSNNISKLINDFIEENINDWKRQFMGQNLLPKSGAEMLEIDKSKSLNVNFSEKLFILIQDCRNLIEYGYNSKIPKELLKTQEEGKKILKEAISLKQITNFYNSISSQVIPSQKEMLGQCALVFEGNFRRLSEKIASPSQSGLGGKGGSGNDLENIVSLLQNAANDLTKELRKLKKAHSTILDYICQLTNYDLISNRAKWKEIIKKSVKIVDEVCEVYKDESTTLLWKNHWNVQLYKVLKIQYSLSLDKFFQNVPVIGTELLINNKNLVFSPPMEELKSKVYKEVNSFIKIPNIIVGFTENFKLFQNIIPMNSKGLENLYSKINVTYIFYL